MLTQQRHEKLRFYKYKTKFYDQLTEKNSFIGRFRTMIKAKLLQTRKLTHEK